VDPPARKLLKAGIPIKLAPQPFKILLLLLESPGEVVNREAIQRHVWGDATFVDFDRGINFSINQIRAALCDDAEKPRYVETLPREGYRFIAELELADGAFAEHPRGTRNSTIHVVETIEHPNKETVTRPDRWRRVAFYGFPTFALAVVVVVGVLLHTRAGAPGITEKDTLVLGDFTNRTGDPIFDETLKQALAIELDQSPFLNVLPDDAVRETLRYMGRSPDEKITPTIARETCERRGIKAMLTGSISNLGRNYAIALEARDCQTGQPLAEQEIEAEGKEHLLRELGSAASKLRGQLGESVRSIQKFDTPLELATTTSLEAMQVYSLGQQRLAHGADYLSNRGSGQGVLHHERNPIDSRGGWP
jgi:eukaryotic-like serine/threonine-protein kinase